MAIGIMEVFLVKAKDLQNNDFLDAGSHPTWNQKFRLYVEFPGSGDNYKVILKLMDHDNFSSDDFIGQATIYVEDLLALGVENGTAELPLAKYRVVTADQSYYGEVQVRVTFTLMAQEEANDEEYGGWKERKDLYYIEPSFFFAPEFLKAIIKNTVECSRCATFEPTPSVFTFEMFNPQFCELMIAEIQNFKKWVEENNVQILRPNKVKKFGVVLDDFGLESMLEKIMDDCIRPVAKGLHVDDSIMTLDVCLGQQFSGGDLYFSGARCD
ncbi:hypothetical protein ACFE04_000375 [Oxalis oulophora]